MKSNKMGEHQERFKEVKTDGNSGNSLILSAKGCKRLKTDNPGIRMSRGRGGGLAAGKRGDRREICHQLKTCHQGG